MVVNPLLARNIVNPDEPGPHSQTPLLIVGIPWRDAIVALIQPLEAPLSLGWSSGAIYLHFPYAHLFRKNFHIHTHNISI